MSKKLTCIMLTLKGWYDKEICRNKIKEIFPSNGKMKIAVACEESDKINAYKHMHIVIHLGKSTTISKKRQKELREVITTEGKDVKFMNGKNAWNDGLKYITKQDKDVGFEAEDTFENVINMIWDCKSEQEVLKLCNKSSDVFPYLEIYKKRRDADRHIEFYNSLKDAKLNDHQIEWIGRLKKQNDRRILWIADYEGENGKSWLGRWMRVNMNAEKMKLNSKAVNYMYQGSEYVYVNMTKTLEDFVSYGALEELKDGDLISDKYQGRSVLYAPPKIIVFANFHPDVSKMMKNRWEIIEIGEEPVKEKFTCDDSNWKMYGKY